MPETDLARNLRHLCAEARSVSEVCRALGINRQQFARYLSGAARPSAHNLRRIARHFAVAEARLDAPHAEFAAGRGTGAERALPDTLPDTLSVAFPGELRALRGYLGSYHAHYRSPSMPDRVIRAYVDLGERHGRVVSRTVERTRHPQTGLVSRARYNGLAAMFDGALFVVEWGRISRGGVSETILTPAHRGARQWLIGRLLGFSWFSRQPYGSVTVWQRLRPSLAAREALAACGSFPADSRMLDPVVREALAAE